MGLSKWKQKLQRNQAFTKEKGKKPEDCNAFHQSNLAFGLQNTEYLE